jgi:lipoyl(octanoyl) transferase
VQARSRHSEGPDFTGVWVGDRKIASIGVHVSQGVTTHGFAINVDNDLQPFSLIVECGLDGVAMTSLARELPAGRRADAQRLRRSVAHEFCAANDRQQRRIAPAELRCAAGGPGRGASVAAGVAG